MPRTPKANPWPTRTRAARACGTSAMSEGLPTMSRELVVAVCGSCPDQPHAVIGPGADRADFGRAPWGGPGNDRRRQHRAALDRRAGRIRPRSSCRRCGR
jgi:hypothetical protein